MSGSTNNTFITINQVVVAGRLFALVGLGGGGKLPVGVRPSIVGVGAFN